jgi:hypothetical protein
VKKRHTCFFWAFGSPSVSAMLESDCGGSELSIFRCPRVVVVCMYGRLSRTERFLPVCGDSTCYFVVTRTEITQHSEDSENSSISYSISTVMRLAHKHHIQSLCRREVTNVDSFAVITSRHNFPVAVLCPEALPVYTQMQTTEIRPSINTTNPLSCSKHSRHIIITTHIHKQALH